MKSHIVSLVLTLLTASTSFLHAQERPNILLAIADDWSFGHAVRMAVIG